MSFLDTLPEKAKEEIKKASACKRLINPNACSPKCAIEYFKGAQSKRILYYIKGKYCAEPEFLWSSLPECAALRVHGKKPWFAVIGRVEKEKFGLTEAFAVVEGVWIKNAI